MFFNITWFQVPEKIQKDKLNPINFLYTLSAWTESFSGREILPGVFPEKNSF
jgi:hypothetical protein